MISRKTILVYNQCLEGHHPSWFMMTIRSFLMRGWNVVAVSPEASQLISDSFCLNENMCGEVFPYDVPIINIVSQNITGLERLFIKVSCFLHVYFERYVYNSWLETSGFKQASLLTKFKKIVLACIVHGVHLILGEKIKYYLLLKREGLSVQQLNDQIAPIVSQSPRGVDFIFFMNMDAFAVHPLVWGEGELPCAWGGLMISALLVPLLGAEAWHAMHSFKGMCFLRQFFVDAYAAIVPWKKWALLPDICNIALPQQMPQLAVEIVRKAANRKILLLCGSIDDRKNIAVLNNVVKCIDSRVWYFVICGKVNFDSLFLKDQIAFRELEQNSENVFVHDQYIWDEGELNSIINISSVLFAIYRDFDKSSNMLAKAAYFEKPILVNTGYYMEEQVKHYGIGYAVCETDIQGIVDKLTLAERIQIGQEAFSAYRETVNPEKFSVALDEFVDACLVEDV